MRTPLLPPEIVDGKWYTTDQLDRLGRVSQWRVG